jgi:energy-coupling factor transport system ATP-binding protein
MIKVVRVSFKYPTAQSSPHYALSEISLSIQAGESIAIMGANGSGKSTFARCLNGLIVPQDGEVVVNGLSTVSEENLPGIRRMVGMVFQNPDNQIVSATVEREIAFGLENLGLPGDEMHRIVEEKLAQFDLVKYRKKSPHYLSGGEKQRLAIAAVLAMDPSYIVLDEPTSLLDPRSRRDILRQIKAFHQNETSRPIASILITQFPEEALFTDRLIVFHRGCVVADDRPDFVFSQADLLGEIGLEPPIYVKLKNLLSRYSLFKN